MSVGRRVFAVVASLVLLPAAHADHWPSWRGPTGNGISSDTTVPVRFGPDENFAWRVELPGPAGATPVVWGDRVFLTTVDADALLLMCFSTEGKELWRQQIGQGNKTARGDEGNSASPSPVTDGKHVWAMMGTGDVACYTVDGKRRWQLNLQDRYGRFRIQFGMSSTPVLHGGRLYFQLIHGDGKAETEEARVVAIDAATGEGIWEQKRITAAHTENEHSYASPVLYNFGGREYLITHGADYTIGHSLDDGSEIWRLGGLNPHDDPQKPYHRTLRFVASPGVAEGIIVCPTAKSGPVFAIRADQTGDLTGRDEAVHWMMPRYTPDVPSPLIHDGLVYLCRENGILICRDQKTGEELYSQRTHPDGQRHRASPVYANGHIYLNARDGRIAVVQAGREFKLVSANKLNELISASPVIANGTLYLRTFDALWAFRQADRTAGTTR